jgi:hypothetical protein
MKFENDYLFLNDEEADDLNAIICEEDDALKVYLAREFIQFLKFVKESAIISYREKSSKKTIQQKLIDVNRLTPEDQIIEHCDNLLCRAYDTLIALNIPEDYYAS